MAGRHKHRSSDAFRPTGFKTYKVLIHESVKGFPNDDNAETGYRSLLRHLIENGANGQRGQHGCGKEYKFGSVELLQIGQQRDRNVRVRFYRDPFEYDFVVVGAAKKKVKSGKQNDRSVGVAFNRMKDRLESQMKEAREESKSDKV